MRVGLVECKKCRFLGPVHRKETGTEAGTYGHRVMPSMPFTELSLSHAQRRGLWPRRIEDCVKNAPVQA
jgi:hypothetical protein